MIKFNNASFTYKSKERQGGVFNISLSIEEGEFVLLTGESGCGKTTLTRLINGLSPEYYTGDLQGEVEINGEKVGQTSIQSLSKVVGSVFQNPKSQFFNVDSTSEIAFGLENMGVDRMEMLDRIGKVAYALNIHELLDRNLFNLSGGEKQKIACASTAVMEAPILVLDEPSSNLDIESIDDLKNILKYWKQQGKTIIIAEHRLYYLMDLVDRVIYMKDGRISKDYSIEEFKDISDKKLHEMGLRSSHIPKFESKDIEYTNEIALDNFCVYYNKVVGLEINHLDLPRKHIIGILGKNGAGKSTFANCLCGIAEESTGIMTLEGKSYDSKERLEISYMVMQDVNNQLFTESVKEEISVSLSSDEISGQVDEILAQLNLLELKELHPMSLSGGQKQRVALASALASNSRILILDEPTSGLDYHNMLDVAQSLKQMKDKTIFLITHDPELLKECCDYFIFLKNGHVEWSGNYTEENIHKLNDFFKT
ncbi:TPA: ABC transporter ATP-binding protein [Streptococcus agalactiae]|nr:ABC transporter ATP-binding protein [Streptococcus agalactiae]